MVRDKGVVILLDKCSHPPSVSLTISANETNDIGKLMYYCMEIVRQFNSLLEAMPNVLTFGHYSHWEGEIEWKGSPGELKWKLLEVTPQKDLAYTQCEEHVDEDVVTGMARQSTESKEENPSIRLLEPKGQFVSSSLGLDDKPSSQDRRTTSVTSRLDTGPSTDVQPDLQLESLSDDLSSIQLQECVEDEPEADFDSKKIKQDRCIDPQIDNVVLRGGARERTFTTRGGLWQTPGLMLIVPTGAVQGTTCIRHSVLFQIPSGLPVDLPGRYNMVAPYVDVQSETPFLKHVCLRLSHSSSSPGKIRPVFH